MNPQIYSYAAKLCLLESINITESEKEILKRFANDIDTNTNNINTVLRNYGNHGKGLCAVLQQNYSLDDNTILKISELINNCIKKYN